MVPKNVFSHKASNGNFLRVRDYDLAATLNSGQVFRWHQQKNSWMGVIGQRWVRLSQLENGILAETAQPVKNWNWLCGFLQTEIELESILKTFPDDEPMRNAVTACRGLRVLRQDPWECLASFILSSTKRIVQIRQIVALLSERFGEPLARPSATCSPLGRGAGTYSRDSEFFSLFPPGGERDGTRGASHSKENHLFYSFPTAERIAAVGEAELRACKMGFRAPHLLAAARQIADGKFDLEQPPRLPLAEARAELMKLHGVGGKIANCVLLFAYGFDAAFPMDVWVERALRQLYFLPRRVGDKRLRYFAATHFGRYAGYAQQYLFHYMRTKMK